MSTLSATTPLPERFGSGQAVRRIEDDALLKGQGRYTDDFSPANLGRLSFLRSPYPHARIESIHTDAARAMPGVLAVLTGADLAAAGVALLPSGVMMVQADRSVCHTPLRPALAHTEVRYVGQTVAAVVAETLQQARDAVEAIEVNYAELPMAVTVEDSLAANAPALYDPVLAAKSNTPPSNVTAAARYGKVNEADAAFAQAAHVVKLNVQHQRVVAVSIEPRTVLAYPDPDTGRLTLRLSTQMPTGVRDTVATALGLEPTLMRVVVDDVGGGFGMKTGAYVEEVVVAYAAKLLQQPVKWVGERSEEFVSTYHGRDLQTQAAMALDANGKVLALRVHSLANVGAFATGTGVIIQLMIGPWVQTSVYDIQTIDFHFQAVLTNTAPTGAYRGAGRPEAIFTIERLMDEAARQTGIDRVELRRRNFIRPEQMPYTNPMGQVYDTGCFEQVMNQGLAQADWPGFAARAAATEQRGLVRGLGIATFLEWTGGNVFEERVSVTVLPAQADGTPGMVEVFCAVNAMGQGIATTLGQLVVDVFGLPMSRVRVVLGDTDRGTGFGSAGSRSIFTGGSALRVGAERTVEKAKQLAANELEVAAEDLAYSAGRFEVKGTDLGIDLFDLAQKQSERCIHLDSTNTVAGPTWPNGCHICEVELDTATGSVQVVAYSSVNDVGRVINPMIVRGQLDGGAVQGMGQALYENMVYDRETGQPVSGSLMDYGLPRADVMVGDFVTSMDESSPCKNNLLGVKGVGELGTIGATPALVNAVADAVARAGKTALCPQLHMPLSPARVWALLNS